MDQQTEFLFVRGSETSKAAALRVDPGKAEIDRAMILGFIRASGARGATDREIQDEFDMPGDTERPRRNELAGRGRTSRNHPFWPVLIRQNGEKRDGCAVWVVACDG